jgi:hypothetical protein
LYADLGSYSTGGLTPPFTPESYIQGINAAVAAGFECVIIDSITHEWNEILASVQALGGRQQTAR